MLLRSVVAAVDWNCNVDRKVLLTASGDPQFKSKVHVMFVES